MSNSFHVAVLPGEGVGPEVIAAAVQVLDAVERRFGIALRQERIEGGALYYKETGSTLAPNGMARAGAADAMLFGAMGWPEIRFPDGREITPQIDIRAEFGLFAGVRPIRAIPGVPLALADPRASGIDLVILRESTEGLFAKRDEGVITREQASDTLVITRDVTERLTRFACDLALRRKATRGTPGRVTLVDKANVFRSFAFMREVFLETVSPEVEARVHYVDAMALDLVRRPWEFDVLPMENMFGDILSDLAAGLIGGMGFAPSADIGAAHGLFQPSHGTAPDIAGTGVANPTAAILSAAMMLEWLGVTRSSQACQDAAVAIERAVDAAFRDHGLRTGDVGGQTGTRAVGDTVAGLITSGMSDPA